ncbi:hypothetical protein M9Y10_016270 [Tritrichomonas musculus]|uniref:Uncharacterized protein n=1 Tax=Tritrichomonas musculus TaxID=1915356 RepID=A0ABR2HW18_9EUKA
MTQKSNKAMFVCDACMDKCVYCGKVEKNMHCSTNYPSKCVNCANKYNDNYCALCGAKIPTRSHTVRRCPQCLKECKKCFKCNCDLK